MRLAWAWLALAAAQDAAFFTDPVAYVLRLEKQLATCPHSQVATVQQQAAVSPAVVQDLASPDGVADAQSVKAMTSTVQRANHESMVAETARAQEDAKMSQDLEQEIERLTEAKAALEQENAQLRDQVTKGKADLQQCTQQGERLNATVLQEATQASELADQVKSLQGAAAKETEDAAKIQDLETSTTKLATLNAKLADAAKEQQEQGKAQQEEAALVKADLEEAKAAERQAQSEARSEKQELENVRTALAAEETERKQLEVNEKSAVDEARQASRDTLARATAEIQELNLTAAEAQMQAKDAEEQGAQLKQRVERDEAQNEELQAALARAQESGAQDRAAAAAAQNATQTLEARAVAAEKAEDGLKQQTEQLSGEVSTEAKALAQAEQQEAAEKAKFTLVEKEEASLRQENAALKLSADAASKRSTIRHVGGAGHPVASLTAHSAKRSRRHSRKHPRKPPKVPQPVAKAAEATRPAAPVAATKAALLLRRPTAAPRVALVAEDQQSTRAEVDQLMALDD